MKKIGIYTITADNFGAQLQAYATAKYLTTVCKGWSVELVSIVENTRKKNWRTIIKSILPSQVMRKKAYQYFKSLLPLTQNFTKDELIKHPLQYEMYVVGSDQVWNVSDGVGSHLVYFFPFQTKSPKIALASSFGTSFIPQKTKKEISNYLSEFSSISVRESDGVNILNSMGICSQQILDPTFWIDANEWSYLAGDKSIIKGEYIATYGFETTNKHIQTLIDAIKETYKIPVVAINGARIFKYDKKYNSCGPIEFLNIIKFSKMVFTGSYHGMVFSILFKKDFFVIPHSTKNSRMENLLSLFNFKNRMLSSDCSTLKSIMSIPRIDYSKLEICISNEQEKTREYIQNTLNKYMI